MAKQQTFTCSLSGRVYRTRRGALNSEQRERRKDYIRLHTTTPQHFVKLLVSKGSEFWGWNLRIDVRDASVCKESYWTSNSNLGVQLKLNIYGTFNGRLSKRRRLTEVLRSHVYGLGQYNSSFHTLGAVGMRPVEEILWLPFSEFPLLSENYDKYVSNKSAFNEWYKEKTSVGSEGSVFASTRPEHIEIEQKIAEASQVLNELLEEKKRIKNFYVEGYKSLWQCQNPEPKRDDFLCEAFGWY